MDTIPYAQIFWGLTNERGRFIDEVKTSTSPIHAPDPTSGKFLKIINRSGLISQAGLRGFYAMYERAEQRALNNMAAVRAKPEEKAEYLRQEGITGVYNMPMHESMNRYAKALFLTPDINDVFFIMASEMFVKISETLPRYIASFLIPGVSIPIETIEITRGDVQITYNVREELDKIRKRTALMTPFDLSIVTVESLKAKYAGRVLPIPSDDELIRMTQDELIERYRDLSITGYDPLLMTEEQLIFMFSGFLPETIPEPPFPGIFDELEANLEEWNTLNPMLREMVTPSVPVEYLFQWQNAVDAISTAFVTNRLVTEMDIAKEIAKMFIMNTARSILIGGIFDAHEDKFQCDMLDWAMIVKDQPNNEKYFDSKLAYVGLASGLALSKEEIMYLYEEHDNYPPEAKSVRLPDAVYMDPKNKRLGLGMTVTNSLGEEIDVPGWIGVMWERIEPEQQGAIKRALSEESESAAAV